MQPKMRTEHARAVKAALLAKSQQTGSSMPTISSIANLIWPNAQLAQAAQAQAMQAAMTPMQGATTTVYSNQYPQQTVTGYLGSVPVGAGGTYVTPATYNPPAYPYPGTVLTYQTGYATMMLQSARNGLTSLAQYIKQYTGKDVPIDCIYTRLDVDGLVINYKDMSDSMLDQEDLAKLIAAPEFMGVYSIHVMLNGLPIASTGMPLVEQPKDPQPDMIDTLLDIFDKQAA